MCLCMCVCVCVSVFESLPRLSQKLSMKLGRTMYNKKSQVIFQDERNHFGRAGTAIALFYNVLGQSPKNVTKYLLPFSRQF